MRYIGETQRNLTLRTAEHFGLSARTGRRVASPLTSSVRTHSEHTNHPLNSSNFKILYKARHQFDLPILESLYIKKMTPELNCNVASYPLLIFK